MTTASTPGSFTTSCQLSWTRSIPNSCATRSDDARERFATDAIWTPSIFFSLGIWCRRVLPPAPTTPMRMVSGMSASFSLGEYEGRAQRGAVRPFRAGSAQHVAPVLGRLQCRSGQDGAYPVRPDSPREGCLRLIRASASFAGVAGIRRSSRARRRYNDARARQGMRNEKMNPTVAIVAQGAMGAGVGARLVERGLHVITSLAGRSEASARRAKAAGMVAVSDQECAEADFFLSICPPSDALALAQKMAALIAPGNKKPIYVDCNAVSPPTKVVIGNAILHAGSPFVDVGIIG